jgi:hypothetical protein
MGFQNVSEFLSRYPGEPYTTVATRLGEDVAALQVMWMQNAEAKDNQAIQHLAMDALARELNYVLPHGWRHGAREDSDRSSAYAFWMTRLSQEISPELKLTAQMVWDELKRLDPPTGWSPGGPDDEYIARAFAHGWKSRPEHGK